MSRSAVIAAIGAMSTLSYVSRMNQYRDVLQTPTSFKDLEKQKRRRRRNSSQMCPFCNKKQYDCTGHGEIR